MKKALPFFLPVTCFLFLSFSGYTQIISTVAGNGIPGHSGDGGAAIMAELNTPYGVAVDDSGNIYIADYNNNRVRKVTPAGLISTFAGTGAPGYSGDSGLATLAQLHAPEGVATDHNGNVYIADYGNNVVRKVNAAGAITTFAGNDTAGYNGDNIQAVTAELFGPAGVATDDTGNVYVSDQQNNRVRKVDTSGIIRTIAGTGIAGYYGDGGMADTAELYFPYGLTADHAGNVYVADWNNNRIRKISPTGAISSIAGNGVPGDIGDGGPAGSAQLYYPTGIALDSAGSVYIADAGSNRIRVVSPGGTINDFAGDGGGGYSGDGGLAPLAELFSPHGVAVSGANIFIADAGNDCIRRVSPGTPPTKANNITNAQAMAIYPNPSSGIFTISLPLAYQYSSLTITDLYGRIIKTKQLIANTPILQLDLTNIPPATYLLSIQNSSNRMVKKLVIQ